MQVILGEVDLKISVVSENIHDGGHLKMGSNTIFLENLRNLLYNYI